MAGAAIPTSLLLLLLLWTCCSFASATRGIDGGEDGGCEVHTDKMWGTQFALDTHALQSANGNVQRILDCLPEGSKVLIDVEDLPLSKDLVIRKPVAIHSRRRHARTKVSGGVIKVRADNTEVKGLKIGNYDMSSTEGFIDIESANGVVIEEVECFGCSNSNGPSCISGTRSSVTIRKMSAKNNSGVNGGAMRFANSTVVIRDSLCEENSSSGYGGALYLETCDLEMENTVFTGNSAVGDDINGGGVYAEGGSWTTKTASVQNCSFIGNSADGSGGGLYYSGAGISGSAIEIVDTDVRDNSAGGNGGGMYIYMPNTTNAVVMVQSSRFIDNSADEDGGGIKIWMAGSTNSTSQIIDSNIVSNSASSNRGGGGVYFDGFNANNCTAEVIGTQIANNAATRGGGGYFDFRYATKSHIRIYTSNIDGNTAPEGGAGMYFQVRYSIAANIRLLLSSFTNNSGAALAYKTYGSTGFDKDDYECTIPENSDNQASGNPFVNKPSSNPTYVL